MLFIPTHYPILMLDMANTNFNHPTDKRQHRGQESYAADGLRILARIIARVHLHNSQLKVKKNNSNKNHERETK